MLMNIHDRIDKFSEFEREVDLNADKKRFWLGIIENMDDGIMNESMP